MREQLAFAFEWQEGALPKSALLAVNCAFLLAGAGAWFAGRHDLSEWLWGAGTALTLVSLATQIGSSLFRGEFGLDLIAALAMGGALILGEYLAGIVIAMMFAGGEALEDFAQRRARHELTALLQRLPRTAACFTGAEFEEIAIEKIQVGDRILVRSGEMLPVDGRLKEGAAMLDESALTGEALPILHRSGEDLMSGSINPGNPFEMLATRTANESTYAGIARLVEAAKTAKAPMSRLADRYALGFLAVTLLLAAAAWLQSGQAARALAVLVIATPCPLILAVPVALISGVSRCASRGILVKGGGALEMLARAKTVMLDKTGTLTDGRARLLEIKVRGDRDPKDVLQMAASIDQGSRHVVACALVAAARERGLFLLPTSDLSELPGSGITGRVNGRQIAVGGWDFIVPRIDTDDFSNEIEIWIRREGTIAIAVVEDGVLAGAFLLADEVRPEAGTVLRQLREAGIQRIVLATGDRADIAESLASFLGIDSIVAEMKPEGKTRLVEREKASAAVMMVGDGVNDAPALAAADVGVAMGARGAAASAEAADVVILVDRLDRLVSAMHIAQRSRRIALQTVYAGMGLSVVGMVFAAFGYLAPIQGALVQEAIDVVAILNALRALGNPLRIGDEKKQLSQQELADLEAEHRNLMAVVDEIRHTSERIKHLPLAEVSERLAELDALLRERLLPHERHDDRVLYPLLRRRLGATHALAGMSRTHMEIRRQVHHLTSLRQAIAFAKPNREQLYEIQRLLHGLEAVVRLHFAQEEEIYRALEAD
ncbi:heavy metal translocating P-type ATPase [Ensifer sp. NPDC090286]|uniref:heavy metal translocating P-type ATPase n=1 Tax=Ensifer sp. NPDC090286 TaxID=3363991 RepID=UPI00383B73DC